MGVITDPQTGLSVGDYVLHHSALRTPFEADGEKDFVSDPNARIVAFVDLTGKFGRITATARFAVLTREMDGAGSNPTNFIMTGKELKVGLFYLLALEKRPETQ